MTPERKARLRELAGATGADPWAGLREALDALDAAERDLAAIRREVAERDRVGEEVMRHFGAPDEEPPLATETVEISVRLPPGEGLHALPAPVREVLELVKDPTRLAHVAWAHACDDSNRTVEALIASITEELKALACERDPPAMTPEERARFYRTRHASRAD